MAIRILINESNASRRAIPIWLVGSNGTTPATSESGNTFMFSIGGVFYGSGGSISATSSAAGIYDCLFSASKLSVLGPGQVMYGSATALPMSTPFEVVPVDSYDSMRLGLFALPNAAAEAAGGLITSGTGTGQLSVSAGSVGLKAQTHSQATIQGVTRVGNLTANDDKTGYGVTSIAAGTYSGVSVEVKAGGIQTTSVGVGNYSGMSVEVKTGGIQTTSIGAGTYSNVTIQGVTRTLNLSTNDDKTAYGVTSIAAGTYSGVSIEVKTGGIQATSVGAGNYSGMSVEVKTKGIATNSITSGTYSAVTFEVSNIAPGTYSGVSVEVKTGGIQSGSLGAGTITAAKFAANAIDAAALAADAGQEIADQMLGRNLAGGSSTGRIVSEALYPLRNRVWISGSTGTVFQVDDATSSWTFTVVSLGTLPIAEINPTGP